MLKVSEDIRRRNNKAVERRNKWRHDYKAISAEIAHYKQLRSLNYQIGDISFANQVNVALRSLQLIADNMMFERRFINDELVDTSYRYV